MGCSVKMTKMASYLLSSSLPLLLFFMYIHRSKIFMFYITHYELGLPVPVINTGVMLSHMRAGKFVGKIGGHTLLEVCFCSFDCFHSKTKMEQKKTR